MSRKNQARVVSFGVISVAIIVGIYTYKTSVLSETTLSNSSPASNQMTNADSIEHLNGTVGTYVDKNGVSHEIIVRVLENGSSIQHKLE